MEKVKQITIVGFAVIVGLVAWGAVVAVLNSEDTTKPEMTQLAQDNTFKNSFISGCVREANKISPNEDNQTYCGCGYDKLAEMYPDFSTNTERLNRIIAEGYNQSETDAVVACIQ